MRLSASKTTFRRHFALVSQSPALTLNRRLQIEDALKAVFVRSKCFYVKNKKNIGKLGSMCVGGGDVANKGI